ncbi:MAG: FAD-binding protein [Chloroflexi bacterium]|nr:FAD-binding protein [Chloroflexota bacterium]
MNKLSYQSIQREMAWGMASEACCYVYYPENENDLLEIFELAKVRGMTVGFRGGGQSYGDASLNGEQILVDLSGWNSILDWDSKNGIITVQSGVTIAQLWRRVVAYGWWPPVVPGSMNPTVGGCASMNIHGKNHWQVGSFGEHVIEFKALLPNGQTVCCSRYESQDLYFGMLGSFGMLGCFLSITLQLKQISTGAVQVTALSAANLDDLLHIIDSRKDEDYVVGWVDCVVGGSSVGRGIVHTARHTELSDKNIMPDDGSNNKHELPSKILGILPAQYLWFFLRIFNHRMGYKIVNMVRYYSGLLRNRHGFVQSLAQFNFLLDYIPNWKQAFCPGGLIQYQCFIPYRNAHTVFSKIIHYCTDAKLQPYLGVVKRHRNDDFLISCNLDGYSLAIDFSVKDSNRARLSSLLAKLDEIVLDAGGRFYFAKDSTLKPEAARLFLGPKTLARLIDLKILCDPNNLLQSNLSRRILPELHDYQVNN